MSAGLHRPASRLSELISTAVIAAVFAGALVLLAAGLAAHPAKAAGMERDGGQHERQDERQESGGERAHAQQGRAAHDGEERRREERRRYERQHYWRYQQPVYAPPPVYVVPSASPGINLVLPLEIRVR